MSFTREDAAEGPPDDLKGGLHLSARDPASNATAKHTATCELWRLPRGPESSRQRVAEL